MRDGNSNSSNAAARDDIVRAVEILSAGGVVAIPTDTVYGLAASLDHPDAIERLFAIKGRQETKAIPILVSNPYGLARLASRVSESASRLMEAFWPGGLTIVVEAAPTVPDAALRGGTTVGVRMPDHPDALSIIAGAGGSLAVTSANPSGEPECRSAQEVRERLGGRVDFVVDAGLTGLAPPSTVVDATTERVRVLRHGAINAERITAVLESGGAG